MFSIEFIPDYSSFDVHLSPTKMLISQFKSQSVHPSLPLSVCIFNQHIVIVCISRVQHDISTMHMMYTDQIGGTSISVVQKTFLISLCCEHENPL